MYLKCWSDFRVGYNRNCNLFGLESRERSVFLTVFPLPTLLLRDTVGSQEKYILKYFLGLGFTKSHINYNKHLITYTLSSFKHLFKLSYFLINIVKCKSPKSIKTLLLKRNETNDARYRIPIIGRIWEYCDIGRLIIKSSFFEVIRLI